MLLKLNWACKNFQSSAKYHSSLTCLIDVTAFLGIKVEVNKTQLSLRTKRKCRRRNEHIKVDNL